MDSVSSVASLATAMHQQQLAQQINLAVVNKSQDMMEEQGQALLKLIESAAVTTQGIDVHV